ncbi:MAG: dockerin type I domain-containing protein, partial [Planctomycetota bacterium]
EVQGGVFSEVLPLDEGQHLLYLLVDDSSEPEAILSVTVDQTLPILLTDERAEVSGESSQNTIFLEFSEPVFAFDKQAFVLSHNGTIVELGGISLNMLDGGVSWSIGGLQEHMALPGVYHLFLNTTTLHDLAGNHGELDGLKLQSLTVLGDNMWLNHALHADVNADGQVSAIDALHVINELRRRAYSNERTSELIARPTGDSGISYYDVTKDGLVTARDALLVINELYRRGNESLQPQGELGNATGVSFISSIKEAWDDRGWPTSVPIDESYTTKAGHDSGSQVELPNSGIVILSDDRHNNSEQDSADEELLNLLASDRCRLSTDLACKI